VDVSLCFYRNGLPVFKFFLGLKKGFGEKAGAVIVSEVRPRDTFLEKLADMTNVSSIEGREGYFSHGKNIKSSIRRQRA
jgi:hypothetical protein